MSAELFTYDPKDIITVDGQATIIETLIEEFNQSQLASGNFQTLPIAAFGRVNVNGTLFTNTSGVGTVAHNLGYPPAHQVYLDLFQDGTAYIHLPYVTGINSFVSPTQIQIYHHSRTDSVNLQLISTATLNYPTNVNARFTFFYFIFAVPMPT